MNKFSDKIRQFMYGRNGNDTLNKFIFLMYFIVFLIYVFSRNYLFLIIEVVLLFLFFFRSLSRNITKRQKENDTFMHISSTIKKPFLRFFHKIRDHKTHVYKKCPNCKNILRLKKIKGSHSVKCPICENHFNIKI
jgi:LSD1 subclass zinc finger protein